MSGSSCPPSSISDRVRSLVVEDAQNSFQHRQSPPPVYFYCSRNPAERGRSDPPSIVASIARQLSCLQPGDPLLGPVITAHKKREIDAFAAGSLRLDESRALIMELIEHYPMVTIIIDALDECDPDTRSELLDTLEFILQESATLIKIFVSSRDDQDIVCQLQVYPNLEILSNRNSDDIAKFVQVETQKLMKRRPLRFSTRKEELQQIIIDQVTAGAHGM